MKIETHIQNSKKRCGVEGTEIHEWMDAHFDHNKFNEYIKTGILPKDWHPYEHRIYRHCIEALDECIAEFKDKYSEDDIKAVFESHLVDDYRGHIPKKEEFLDKKFHDKYHNK